MPIGGAVGRDGGWSCRDAHTRRTTLEGDAMTKKMAVKTAAALLTTGLTVGGFAAPAFAKITTQNTSCTTRNGQLPPGQQPTCQGGGLVQHTKNVNPAGFAPPGQNK